MAKKLLLLKLEIKKAFLSIPKILLSTFIFGILVILVGLTSDILMKQADSENESNRLEIALVLPDKSDSATEMLFSYVGEIDTVKGLCKLTHMDAKTAFEKLKKGEIFSILTIPDNFLDNMIAGHQTPVEIILARSGRNTSSAFFRELLIAASNDLGACEAGIYAVGDTLLKFGYGDDAYKFQDELGEFYVSYALERSIYFKNRPVTAAGHITMIGFYICSGIMMILLFCSITCGDLLKRDSACLITALHRQNISGVCHILFKLTGISLVFDLIVTGLYGFLCLVSIRFPEFKKFLPQWGIGELLVLFLIIFSIFTFVTLIYELSNSISTGSIIIFLLSVLFLFIAGSIMPLALLPKGIQQLSVLSPVTYWQNALQHIYMGVIYPIDIFAVTIVAVIMVTASGIINHIRQAFT